MWMSFESSVSPNFKHHGSKNRMGTAGGDHKRENTGLAIKTSVSWTWRMQSNVDWGNENVQHSTETRKQDT